MAQGSFDDIIRQESRRGGSQRGNGAQDARDRAAKRMNAKSGKNPNPRTSSAYKEEKPKVAGKGRNGGGKAGVPSKKKSPGPSASPSQFPDEMQVPGQQNPKEALPTIGTDAIPWLIPLIVAGSRALAARRQGGAAPGEPTPDAASRVPTQEMPPVEPMPPAGQDDDIGRFLTESEIGEMQKKMPGVIKSPGWGPTKLPPGMQPPVPELPPGAMKGFRP